MLEKLTQQEFSNATARTIVRSLLSVFRKRRSTRHFDQAPIDIEIIKMAVAIAGTAPSGANKQPWSFAIIQEQELKSAIRQKAEEEESLFYAERAPQKWLRDLEPLHTDATKEFLTEASYLIPIFYATFDVDAQGAKSTHYYAKESVGIATGLLIAALHLAGLSVLTYTPSNRRFMTRLLNRQENENAFLVLAVGLPHPEARVPQLSKKTLSDILTIYKNVSERNSTIET
ncbi:MAG: nitroreductase family protein [Bdellovibrionaceae bacterium]|nr:nitroreductase family protein [Bdellovibrionales bacterium]MCB9083967.1 nitroreductase family protein [Pseudobdellovibrionaceae bacterium]